MKIPWLMLFIYTFLLAGCLSGNSGTPTAVSPSACNTDIRYDWDDANQETRKYTEYLNDVTKTCGQKRLQLTTYEKGLDYRRRNKTLCKPQSIGSVWLKTNGNFYSYRNDRIYLELNAESGQFRRISIGITSDNHSAGGNRPSFSRDLGCFYIRTDHETEPVNPQNYGSQILLDLGPSKASTEEVKPSEIFRYTKSGNSWITTRFDMNSDIDWSFCPESLVPWEFCTALRNGNPYFYPNLDATTEANLLQQALFIRSEYNYVEVTKSDFESIWNQAEKNYIETPLQSFKYQPLLAVDVPDFVWDAWAAYVRGDRSAMPDVSSPSFPTFCYPSEKQVTFTDGSSGIITGTACYDGAGQYSFQ